MWQHCRDLNADVEFPLWGAIMDNSKHCFAATWTSAKEFFDQVLRL
jgi:hypothetical protein